MEIPESLEEKKWKNRVEKVSQAILKEQMEEAVDKEGDEQQGEGDEGDEEGEVDEEGEGGLIEAKANNGEKKAIVIFTTILLLVMINISIITFIGFLVMPMVPIICWSPCFYHHKKLRGIILRRRQTIQGRIFHLHYHRPPCPCQ